MAKWPFFSFNENFSFITINFNTRNTINIRLDCKFIPGINSVKVELIFLISNTDDRHFYFGDKVHNLKGVCQIGRKLLKFHNLSVRNYKFNNIAFHIIGAIILEVIRLFKKYASILINNNSISFVKLAFELIALKIFN